MYRLTIAAVVVTLLVAGVAVAQDAAPKRIGPIIFGPQWEFSVVAGASLEQGVMAGAVSYQIAQTSNEVGLFWADLGIKFDGSDYPDLFAGLSTNLRTDDMLGTRTRAGFGYLVRDNEFFMYIRTPLSLNF